MRLRPLLTLSGGSNAVSKSSSCIKQLPTHMLVRFAARKPDRIAPGNQLLTAWWLVAKLDVESSWQRRQNVQESLTKPLVVITSVFLRPENSWPLLQRARLIDSTYVGGITMSCRAHSQQDEAAHYTTSLVMAVSLTYLALTTVQSGAVIKVLIQKYTTKRGRAQPSRHNGFKKPFIQNQRS